LVETSPLHVTVDLHSELSLGKTMADFYQMWSKPPNMQVALKVQSRRFIELFLERIEALARRLG
jgi:inosine-uridine nucleoside N-ribohydrolase